MLKKKIRALDEVDAQFRTEYEKHADGFFHLKVEPDPDEGGDDEPDASQTAAERRLKEFRKENVRLRKEMDEFKAKFEGLDMDAYQNAVKYAEQARSEEERALLKAGRFDDVLNARVAKTREALDKELAKEKARAAELEKTATKFRQQLHADGVRAKLRAAADDLKLKLVPTGVEDFYARGLRTFTTVDDNGELVAMDGEDARLNAENKPYGPKDFVHDILNMAPHLVEGASGADVQGGSRKGRGGSAVIDIDASNPKSMGANIEAIAKGKLDVRVR